MKKFSSPLVFLFLIITSISAQALDRQEARVEQVLAGDAVRLSGGKILRYASIQAPSPESSNALVREYAINAIEFNRALVEGKKIFVEWGFQIRDRQNALMGYVFLEDGRSVNLEILKAGHAQSIIQAPNLKYAADFRRAELEARRNKRGLWIKTPDNPNLRSEYIGEKNTKIYYFPTSPELDDIPEAQWVRFNSRVAAKAAGYRPCHTCHEDEVVLT